MKKWYSNCTNFDAIESLKSTPTGEEHREIPCYSCTERYLCPNIPVWTEFHLFASKAHDLGAWLRVWLRLPAIPSQLCKGWLS